MKGNNTFHHILDVAETLVQTRGYHAFSFRDLAKQVGIKTASVHYYFPTKQSLGCALVKRHTENMFEVLNRVSKSSNYKERLLSYLKAIVGATYEDGKKMCLGGMLAIDVATLEEEMKIEVEKFFQLHEKWLATTLEEGRKQGEFSFTGSGLMRARAMMALLEGTLILARLFDEDKRVKELSALITVLVT